jgi:DNA-binding MarR family transcriptional regulator
MSQLGDLNALPPEANNGSTDGHIKLIELLFFAYRDFTGDADALLVELGFGRAHHRVLHFANRTPGLTVAELLDILKITKQSLARVLKELIDTGHIYQVHGAKDRRQRELHLSQKGRELTASLTRLQSKRIASALDEIGWEHTDIIGGFLKAMVDQNMRGQINARHGDEHGRSDP